jgi:spore coat polysaccharide biosynthesis protein SpsF
MGSTRLPGKVLRPIAGKPLIWHVVHRLKRCKTLHSIAIATSEDFRDDPIEWFCREEDIEVVRGPENNVLERFAIAAEKTQADIIVRVSSDAPFLDPLFIDHLVEALIAQNGDYVLVQPGALCAHEGVDPFSRRALDKLVQEAADDPIAREHVSGYFKRHPDFVRIVYAEPDPRLAHKGARLTIDTPDDLAFIEALHERMEAKAGEASLADLLLLLDREPKLKTINAHVQQKPLDTQGGLALLRCDGGGTLGFGHVKRCLTLARALRDREGIGCIFAVNGSLEAADAIKQAGFEAVLLPHAGNAPAFATLVAAKKPDILIADARENLTRSLLARAAANVPVVATIDDGSDRRLAGTHAYYPPVRQVETLSWHDAQTIVRMGWEWALLGFDPAPAASTKRSADAKPVVIISMGGSDPLDLTRLAASALAKITTPLTARFVIGPGFRNAQSLARDIDAMAPNFELIRGATDLSAEFASADLAVVSFGVTAYELAAFGVPALYLPLNDDHAHSASAFEEAGMGKILGLGRAVRAEDIARAVWKLLIDEELRRDMRAAGLSKVDGRAAIRIAEDLALALARARAAKRDALTSA